MTRQACYERQKAMRAKGNDAGLRERYCADAGKASKDPNARCGLGRLHWQAVERGTMTLIERAALPPRSRFTSFGRQKRKKG